MQHIAKPHPWAVVSSVHWREVEIVWILWALRSPNHVHTIRDQPQCLLGAVRDWSIFIHHGFFDWVDEPKVGKRKELLHNAIDYWFDQYPIGYTDVAKRFGVKPVMLYGSIQRTVAKLPEQLRPKRIHFWGIRTKSAPGKFRMAVKKLSYIPCRSPVDHNRKEYSFWRTQRCQGALGLREIIVGSCRWKL